MKTKLTFLACLWTAAAWGTEGSSSGFDPGSGYQPGDLIGQPTGGSSVWTGDRNWLFVDPEAGRSDVKGTFGLLSAPTKRGVFVRSLLALPEGPADSGRVRFGFDLIRLEGVVDPDRDRVVVAISLGRDATPPARGRALRFVISNDDGLTIVNRNELLRNAVLPGEWVTFSGIADYAARTVTLELNGRLIGSYPFMVEGTGGPQDERGLLEIASGGGEGHRFALDNLVLENVP
jgi:hypothetical protein